MPLRDAIGRESMLTTSSTTAPTGTPKTPAEIGWISNQRSCPGGRPTNARKGGALTVMYQIVTDKPASIPATAPLRFARGQKIPKTIAGTNTDAASENDAETSGRISAGLIDAKNAATSATAISANLDRITRCSGVTFGLTSCVLFFCSFVLLLVWCCLSVVVCVAVW